MKTILPVLLVIITTFQFSFAQQRYTKGTPLPCLDKEFTIVAHIVRDTFGQLNITEEEILVAIDSMNFYFEPICASFKICEFRIIDNYQYNNPKNRNEFEQMQVKFHQKNRINMFFVNGVSWSVDPCGFATNGGIEMLEEGGILINKPCLTPGLVSKGMPHIMGHYFGLYDTNRGEGSELVDGTNCLTEGDEICDTPSDPYVNGLDFYNPPNPIPYLSFDDSGCRFVYIGGLDANGEYYRTHTSNIMSMYPEHCKCGFTHEQFLKMANLYLNAEDKMW